MVISITRVPPNTKWIVSRPLARRLSTLYPPTFLFVDNQKYAINEWSIGLSHSLLMLVTLHRSIPVLINLAYQFRLADERDFLIWLI